MQTIQACEKAIANGYAGGTNENSATDERPTGSYNLPHHQQTQKEFQEHVQW